MGDDRRGNEAARPVAINEIEQFARGAGTAMSFQKYYAVIFTSQRTAGDDGSYETMAARMAELASAQKGFLGVESARDGSGAGITVSYWQSLEDIAAWRDHVLHQHAQRLGKERWYSSFRLRIAEVFEDRSWPPAAGGV